MRTRSRKQIRDNSASSTPDHQPPAALTVGGGREPPLDVALDLFLRRPPSAADHLMVHVVHFDREDIVCDVTRGEVSDAGADVANQITMATRALAETERKECRFRAQWCASDRVLGSYAWRAGQSFGDAPTLDGSMQSLLAQNQRHVETLMRAHADRDARQDRALDSAHKVITSLERKIQQLEERIDQQAQELAARKSGSDDFAREELAHHLESKTRLQEIAISRVLPLVEMMAASHLGKAGQVGGAAALAAVKPGDPDPSTANGAA